MGNTASHPTRDFSLVISSPLQAPQQPMMKNVFFSLLIAYYCPHGACSADKEIATFASLESRCFASLGSSVCPLVALYPYDYFHGCFSFLCGVARFLESPGRCPFTVSSHYLQLKSGII